MEKRFFLVSTLVVMTMAAIFVSCKKEDGSSTIENGCTCTLREYGTDETETEEITAEEMKEIVDELVKEGVIINSCSDYSDYVMTNYADEAEGSISCK